MAKATIPAAPSVVGYAVGWHDAPPPRKVGAGNGDSALTDALRSMGAPEGGRYASFFVPATISDTIKPEEQEQAFKDASRKLSSKITGAFRRITKSDPARAYSTRNTVEDGVIGVRVWRVEPAAPPVPAAPQA